MGDLVYKFVIVGGAGVGKSAILERLIDDKYNDDYTPTVGIDCRIFDMKSKNIKIQIWDTSGQASGQERYNNVPSSYYYNNSDALIMCYDSTDAKTFLPIRKLIASDKDFQNIPVKIIVATKSDLIINDDSENNNARIEEFAQFNNFLFIKTSAKYSENIDEIFTNCARQLLIKDNETRVNKIITRSKKANEIKKNTCCSIL